MSKPLAMAGRNLEKINIRLVIEIIQAISFAVGEKRGVKKDQHLTSNTDGCAHPDP